CRIACLSQALPEYCRRGADADLAHMLIEVPCQRLTMRRRKRADDVGMPHDPTWILDQARGSPDGLQEGDFPVSNRDAADQNAFGAKDCRMRQRRAPIVEILQHSAEEHEIKRTGCGGLVDRKIEFWIRQANLPRMAHIQIRLDDGPIERDPSAE